MAELKDLLSNFKNIINKGEAEKDVIVRVFERVLGKKIERDDISIKKEVLIVKSDAYLKSEIHLHKDNLLREIKKHGIEKTIKDIK